MAALTRSESLKRNIDPLLKGTAAAIIQAGTAIEHSVSIKHKNKKLLHQRAHEMSGMIEQVMEDRVMRISIDSISDSDIDGKKAAEKELKFTPCRHDGLSLPEVEALRAQWGKNELPMKQLPKWKIILQLLTMPMPIVLWIATIIEGIIENYLDMGILLGIQFVNAGISFYETTKAADAVAVLKASLKPKATCKRAGKWEEISATELVPGDLVLLAMGSSIPADCYINPPGPNERKQPEIEVDQSAMTGESLPAKFRTGDLCKMGSMVKSGEVEGTVESTGANTFFGKTAVMIQTVEASGGSLERLLLKIMIFLVGISVILCSVAMGYLVAMGRNSESVRIALVPTYVPKADKDIVKDSLSFAVVLLVASIPVAIEIVTTTTLALGSRYLSGHGAIVTTLSAIEEMAGMNMLCSDKTGTLTMNKMVIQDDCPTFTPGETKESILFQAALAAKWKEPPRDALDTMILITAEQDLSKCDAYEQLEYLPFDPRVKRTEAKLKGPDGKMFLISKGAPHVILDLCSNKEEIRHRLEAKVAELGGRGVRSLAVARQNIEEGHWKMLGILTFLDPPRSDTKETIENCRKYGVEVKMVTGDHEIIARETARMLNMGSNILGAAGLPVLQDGRKVPKDLVQRYGKLIRPAHGFAQVYPEHKYLIVECLRKMGFRCGMTGDGVNDAPALKRADVGIAVQGATEAAQASADIVLTREGLSTIIIAIQTAREIFCRLKTFICYRIAASLYLLVFFFIAVFMLKPIDYYQTNFCPSNLLPTAVISCYGAQMPPISTLIGNGAIVDWFKSRKNMTVQVNLLIPTPWTCAANQQICQNNASLATYMEGTYLADTKGGWTQDQKLCLRDVSGTCIPATAAWPDFFQLPVLMLMLITLLNDGTLISIGYDSVKPSVQPERWKLSALILTSSVLGAVACASSLLLLWAALDSNNPTGLFASIGIPPLEYGKIVAMLYLNVSLSDFLTLFSARTQDNFLWSQRPGNILLSAALISLAISTVLACAWPEGTLDRIPVMGLARGDYKLMPLWVWLYSILCWFIQDFLKVTCVYTIERFKLFEPPVKSIDEGQEPDNEPSVPSNHV